MARGTGALKRTPLYAEHRAAGAKMVPFAGFEMPVLYEGVIAEHRAVRGAAGLFDVSHMGELYAEGPRAEAFLQRMTTNDVAALEVGRVQYSTMCYPDGGIVDDLTVYRLGEGRYMLIVNASNIGKDFEWLRAHGEEGMTLTDASDSTALLALQGPRAQAILSRLTPFDLARIRYYWWAEAEVAGERCLLSRTGYTGEDGFEICLPGGAAPALWRAVLGAGASEGLKPVGLGARDTLRTEMRYALYGNDITAETTPLEAGLGWVVKFKKGDFVGREALLRQREEGLRRKLVGFEMVEPGIPRPSHTLLVGGAAGFVTSGTMSPSLDKAIGIGYVPAGCAQPGTELAVDIRGRPRRAVVVETPFYRRPGG